MKDVSDPEKMVSPRVVLELIEQWRSLDLPRMHESEINEALRELINGLRTVVSSTREGEIRTIYRARFKRRKNGKNYKDWPWRDIQALIHPVGPDIPLGRCNSDGESVLYCADKFNTALREIRAEEGDEVVLIEYNVIRAALSNVVGDLNPTTVETGEPIFEGDELVSFQIVRDFIRSEFTKPVRAETRHLYRVSAAICREWFDDSLDGWIYPSVESPAHECFVLRGSSVEKRIAIKPNRTSLVRVFAVQDRCFAVQSLKRAVLHEDERVDWEAADGRTKWHCDGSHSFHMAPTPVKVSPVFNWIKSRFRRVR